MKKDGMSYLAGKKLPTLLRGIKSNLFFIVWIAFIHSQQKNQAHKKVCETDFCNVIMLSRNIKILEFKQYQKSHKTRCIIYSDLECLTKMINGYKNNPENLSSTKIDKHIPSIFSFKSTENKHDLCKDKYCMKKFCEYLRDHAV